MSETFYINDMQIQFDFEPYNPINNWFCSVALMKINKRFRFIDNADQFRIMCQYMNTTYPPEQVYRAIINKIASTGQMARSEMAMYEEYFGISGIKGLTIREQERLEIEQKQIEHLKNKHTLEMKNKLSMTFWGSLIVEDILK